MKMLISVEELKAKRSRDNIPLLIQANKGILKKNHQHNF